MYQKSSFVIKNLRKLKLCTRNSCCTAQVLWLLGPSLNLSYSSEARLRGWLTSWLRSIPTTLFLFLGWSPWKYLIVLCCWESHVNMWKKPKWKRSYLILPQPAHLQNPPINPRASASPLKASPQKKTCLPPSPASLFIRKKMSYPYLWPAILISSWQPQMVMRRT